MKQVLVAAPISEKFKNYLVENNYELISYELINANALVSIPDPSSRPSNLQPSTFNLQHIIGIITSNKLLLDQCELKKYPALRWIARLGSGMEIIDIEWCDQHNIQYFSSPEGIANSVAEHVTGMLLCLLHKINSSHNEIRSGHWIREANRGTELAHLTVGIIGYGHTGRKTARILTAFTERVLVYDKYKSGFSERHIFEASLKELKAEADIISFHVPLNTETRHYYNLDFFNAMKKNHIVLNASRGAVVQTPVLLQGLQSGKVTGACLDVLEEEHQITEILMQDNNIIQQLLGHDVILTPHIAGYSDNAVEKMSNELMNHLKRLL